ncbi:MAG: SpoVG family protein [Oscillospiraceae bacterium]|jgi:stage V sporulation protein G|nr:SpoVG family protein [Oscillospiraceae bacterium]
MKLKATINRLLDKGNVKAIASLTVDDAFAVHGIKIMTGVKGDFVSMPSVKQADGKYRETFHAITAEARQQMNDTVMAAYEQKLAEQNEALDAPEPERGQVME